MDRYCRWVSDQGYSASVRSSLSTHAIYHILTAHFSHDGATTAKIYLNNKLVCESKAIYGGESAALDGKRWQTITAYEDCKDPIKISVGDKLTMSAEYDLTKYRL